VKCTPPFALFLSFQNIQFIQDNLNILKVAQLSHLVIIQTKKKCGAKGMAVLAMP
jgi:hypothetical protein